MSKVKKAFILVAIFAVCFAVAFSTTYRLTHTSRAEIQNVRFQSRVAATNSMVTLTTGRQVMSGRKYAQQISGIDTSHCPADFRIAWNDFVFCWQERSRINTDSPGLE